MGRNGLTIFFDGGGGGARNKPFACAIVAFSDGRLVHEESKALGTGLTSNVAEYEGLLLALDFAAEFGAQEVQIRSDSRLVVEQVLGNWRVKNPALRDLHAQAISAARRLNSVRIDHVHREQNRLADKLCGEEIGRQIRRL